MQEAIKTNHIATHVLELQNDIIIYLWKDNFKQI